MEINIGTFLTNYEDSLSLHKYKLPELLYEESPVYIIPTGQLGHLHLTIGDGRSSVKIGIDYKMLKSEDVIKAYNVAELGLLLPTEFIMPINTVRGWAWTGNDGNIILKDKFYKTEADARAAYILYFLELTIIEVSDIEIALNKNIKLLQ